MKVLISVAGAMLSLASAHATSAGSYDDAVVKAANKTSRRGRPVADH